MVQDLQFADVFPRADEAQWRALVARVLKGAPFEKLISRTADGIEIQPLYARLIEERPRALRETPGAWRIAARIEHSDAEAARAQIASDLSQGANALHLVFPGSIGANGLGLAADAESVATILAEADLDTGLSIEIDLGAASKDAALHLADLITSRHIDPRRNSITFGFDPLGQMVFTGGTPMPWAGFAPLAAQQCKALAARGFEGRFFVADGRLTHAAGGTEAQELAFTLGAAISYLRALEAGGVELDAARRMISFRLAADADLFSTVAKLRALRGLWARIEEACGLAPQPLHLHVETAWRMLTCRDPWVNLLRNTVACLGAGLGGADVVSVQAFTQALGLPDAFARRLARNTQTILLEESGLGHVADPVAGSGGFEALTQEIGATAWSLFQDMEREGGLFAQLSSGSFQTRVDEAAEARATRIARRSLPITGTSEFPLLTEAPVDVLAPLSGADPLRAWPVPMARLLPRRDAAAFEQLRDAADARLAATGARPRIFLANLGTAADFTARAMFAKSLFEAGGIEAIGYDGVMTDADVVAAFDASGATLACLCSSDDIYRERAILAARALTEAGAQRVWLAGRPGTSQAEWNAAGLEDFIFAGCDAIAVLTLALTVASA
jgi:methylmalonyl-CoA mutase